MRNKKIKNGSNESKWIINFDKIEDSTRKNYFSLLPKEQQLMEYFSQAFVLNKPKGNVGGDGFWIHNHKDTVYLASFTCFGEGHLASMMFRFYMNALKKMIERYSINSAGSIIQFLDREVQVKFKNKKNILLSTNADVGVVKLNTKTKEMEFAGANMNLLQVHRKGVNIIWGEEIQVGETERKRDNYGSVSIENTEDSNFFLCSTGVFNLKDNTNFKHLSMSFLGEFLRHKRKVRMKDQKKIIQQYLSESTKGSWQNNNIMIIGFKA